MTVPGRPSWAGGANEGKSSPKGGALAFESSTPPASLVAAVVGMVGLAVAEAVHVLGRDDLLPAMRGFLLVVIGGQVVAAALALRRSSAAVMLLLLCATTALVASLAGGLGTAGAAGAIASLLVLVLLARSLRWFPGYQL